MRPIRFLAVATAFALTIAAPIAPVAASTTINFPMTSGGAGSSAGRVFTVTVGSTTVKVRVTGWSTTGTSNSSTVEKGGVNVYSNGLGVTNTGEGSSSPNHTVDNSGRKDFLIFQFDQPVEMDSAKFTTYNMGSTRTDGDATIAYGSSATSWMTDLLASTSTYGQLSTVFGNSFEASNVASTSGQTSVTRALNPSNKSGNVWLIGAAFSNPAENCGYKKNQLCLDGFKLSQVAVSAVPEPSTWMMMLLGFGFVGFSMRRRKSLGTVNAPLRLA